MKKYNKLDLILTFKCNATCKHCSIYNKKSKILTLDKIEKLFDKIKNELDKKVYITFHGGEATMIGEKKFIEIVEYLEKRFPNKFNYLIQTNLLSYNDKWEQIFKKYNITVSTSYDFFTTFRNINGNIDEYWKLWYKNIKKLQQYQKKVKVLVVINHENYLKSKEIYELAKKENWNLLFFNYYTNDSKETMNQTFYYKNFLESLLSLYLEELNENPNLLNTYILNPLTYLIKKIIYNNNDIQYCTFNNNCINNKLLVTPKLDFYTCLSFYNFNILQQEILNDNRLLFHSECITCKYYHYCKGGCLLDRKLDSYGSPNLLCETWKSLIQKILDFKENMK